MPKSKEVNVVATIEKEEAKRKKNKKKNKKKKVASIKETQSKKKTICKEMVQDTSHNLPETLAKQRIVCHHAGRPFTSNVHLSDVKATSKSIYVDDIHHANPTVLQTIHWVHMPNTRHVVARVTEDEYERIYRMTKEEINHYVNVVDCAVNPTLTYGSWLRKDIKNDFPSAAQIQLQDEEFKENPTNFHNPPVRLNFIEDEDTEEDMFDFGKDDELDFSEED